MILTQEEARQKWCPQARVVHENGDGTLFTAGNSFGDGCRSVATRCIASECMAWKWLMSTQHGTGANMDKEGVMYWTRGGRSAYEPPPDARGFCGLAHRV